jgi:subtilisin family serine protease
LSVVLAAPVAGAGTTRAYLIGSKAPLTAAQVRALKNAGATVKYAYKNFGGAAAAIPSSKVAAVRALRFVTGVRPDTIRQLASVEVERAATAADLAAAALPNDPYWLDLIDAENNATYTGDGVWVAVLDSGFYPNWRDYFDPDSILTDRARAFNGPLGSVNPNQWDVGSDPHGMAVAATIVGHRLVDDRNEGGWGGNVFATGAAGEYWVPGVAPDAKIIPIKVCMPLGCFGSAINAGMDYVTSLKKANPTRPIVINESLGGAGFDPLEKAAIDAATEAGVIIVAAAGNDGNSGMGYPGAYEPVVSVGAGGWVDQWTTTPAKHWWWQEVPENDMSEIYIAGFSSRQVGNAQYLDIVSTGRYLLLPYPCANLYKDGQIVSRTNHRTCASKATPDNAQAAPFQYLFISGTSFSAPTVAGIAALMLDKNPSLNNADANTAVALNDPTNWDEGAFEDALEGSATDIAAGSVNLIHRDGTPLLECWEVLVASHPECTTLEATGHGWVFVDDALAAAGP